MVHGTWCHIPFRKRQSGSILSRSISGLHLINVKTMCNLLLFATHTHASAAAMRALPREICALEFSFYISEYTFG